MGRNCKRGEIYFAKLESPIGSSVIRCKRPVLIISNDTSNHSSGLVNIIPITSQRKKQLPVHVDLNGYGLSKGSIAIAEQILTIDKCNLIYYIGTVDEKKMKEIADAVETQLSLSRTA